MSVTDIKSAADMMVGRREGKILLIGTCWYELTGLWHLLSDQGYDVYRVPLGYSCAQDCWDLVIVALSAESVAGWGRYIARIRELSVNMSGKMLVLMPEKLEKLKILRGICLVYNGCVSLKCLNDYICVALRYKRKHTERFRLTNGQCRALKRLSEKGRDKPLSLKREEYELYYHYARLAENVGVRDFRLLLMTGLDRELWRED